jgi:putative spermidine/putrescine transport system permease protein
MGVSGVGSLCRHHPAVIRDRIWNARRYASSRRSLGIRVACPGRAAVAHRRRNHHAAPLAIPGLAIALALLLTYGGFSDFRRSWLFILTGHVIFTMPFMVRSVMAVFATVDIKTLDEGAASLGASPWRRFRDVIVPNAVPGILAGSLMVVTLSLGEFNLTWMLHTPLTKTLPVGLADSYASMRLEVASAYTLIFFVMIIPLLVAMQIFADKEQAR